MGVDLIMINMVDLIDRVLKQRYFYIEYEHCLEKVYLIKIEIPEDINNSIILGNLDSRFNASEKLSDYKIKWWLKKDKSDE